jgi:predicted dehydrogenase
VPCETWDNAILGCEAVSADGQHFPMLLSTKRIAPGNANTWFIRINGTALSVEFSTKNPKQLRWLPYTPGGEQAWQVMDIPCQSAYKTITGEIFEFGFSDSILQMWAAFCDELVNGPQMMQPFGCATPEETAASHRLFTAALQSQRSGQTIAVL